MRRVTTSLWAVARGVAGVAFASLWMGCTGPGDDTDLDTDLDTDPATEAPWTPVEPWVMVDGGTFVMGRDWPEGSPPETRRETPPHPVTVPSFAMLRHEVTNAMFRECLEDGFCLHEQGGQGNCLDPFDPDNANRPANCIDWAQAGDLCAYLDGRLPTESEWEYVATSGGETWEYPWGDAPPDCTRANLPTEDAGSCDDGVWEVCSRPDGDTPWGFCDMGGNAFEWNEDWFWDDYSTHPDDGSAQLEILNEFRVMRGGGVNSAATPRTRQRTFHPPDFFYSGMGVRCARDL